MSAIKSINNFPDFLKSSRDLTYFTTLLDLVINQVDLSISQLDNNVSPISCSEAILPILSKIANVPDKLLDVLNLKQLRLLLLNYMLIYRYRGSIRGINQAIIAYNKITNSTVTKITSTNINITTYTITINANTSSLFLQLLNITKPVGWQIIFSIS